MVVGEALELFIVLGVVLFSILILVVIDNLGTLRRGDLEEEEEEI